ncbi:hypothetical protein [Paenibacillus sp. Leaf72]|uniref:hypothetical protein n=1 Tax=Paenibacillus sp. Leaf72 TaxID=1736234 RepID=UPI0006FA2CB0|nr:hypothetical protein [Paenibacillus sp. Leaf72]KQO18036.1 hypothetical protein ASF12_05150 [Paenibacillus sp. Leaf72]
MNRIEELINELISTVYSSTNSALSVADQITFFWGTMLLADDSPRRLTYAYKSSLNYTWKSLRIEKEYALKIIQDRILPIMKSHRSYLPKRIAKGGDKLTITAIQCVKIIEILSEIYNSQESWYLWDDPSDLSMYDHLLSQLFEESVDGQEVWIPEKFADFLTSFAMHHSDHPKSIHDINCRSGQLLTAMNTQMHKLWGNAAFKLTGYSISPVMTRISTFRLLLNGVKKFSILNLNTVSGIRKQTSYKSSRSNEMHDIIFIYPQDVKNSSLERYSEFPYERDLFYLRYGLEVCNDEGGWIIAVLSEDFLDNHMNELLAEIENIATIEAIISLPMLEKTTGIPSRNFLIPIQVGLGVKSIPFDSIKRYSISDFTHKEISTFWDDYNNDNGTLAPINSETEVTKTPEIYQLILSSISNYTNENSQNNLNFSSRIINGWYKYLESLGTVNEVTNALQILIRDQYIEAVISGEGQVFFRLKQSNSSNNNSDSRLKNVLSLEQWKLYQIFCNSDSPIAIHKARQSLEIEDQRKLTIQHALDTVYLLNRLGYLERIDELLDGDRYSFIDTWMVVPEGERIWKYTV